MTQWIVFAATRDHVLSRTENVLPFEIIQMWCSLRNQGCTSRCRDVENKPAQQLVSCGDHRGPHDVVLQLPLTCVCVCVCVCICVLQGKVRIMLVRNACMHKSILRSLSLDRIRHMLGKRLTHWHLPMYQARTV